MTCSKLFSGDLPELLNEIIQYLHDDYRSLHSCVLVNRTWCRLSIPLLWKNPFSVRDPKNRCYIEVYLSTLIEDYKKTLYQLLNRSDLFPSNTLFNYPSFIRSLNTYKIIHSIKGWCNDITNSSFYQPGSHLTKMILWSLFLIFIESGTKKLHSLEFSTFEFAADGYYDGIYELILHNPNFIRNIKDFKFELVKETNYLTRFLNCLCSNHNSISSLKLRFNSPCDDVYTLSRLFKSQKNLRKISLGPGIPLNHSLLFLKNSNCSNTLNTISFCGIDFKNISILSEAFNQLNVLESIHIIFCHSLDSKLNQQIKNITKPFKLRTLFLNELLEYEKFLIKKSGNYLENIGILNNYPRRLLEYVLKYCKNIKFVGRIVRLEEKSIDTLFNLIKNFSHTLNYLQLESRFSSMILQNLGQILPRRMKYFYLSLKYIEIRDLKVFFKNSQDIHFKKLSINNAKDEECRDIFPCIKKHIIKMKRVEFFSFSEHHRELIDLFDQKDEVKEFEQHGIRVLNHNCLYLTIFEYLDDDIE